MYVYEMPFGDRHRLCQIMDSYVDMWKGLAAEIGLTTLEVNALEREYLRMNGSPTDRLLTKWGHKNATVDMLAYKLINIKALRALEEIKHLVSRDIILSMENELSLSEASTGQYLFRNRHSSDDNLPLPCPSPDKYEDKHNEKAKKNDELSHSSVLNIEDARLKRISFYPYVKIAMATNNFSDRSFLGKGSFGMTYKGEISQSVAVIKVSKKKKKLLPSSVYDEIELLTKHPHQNLITLTAISQDGPTLCLVYLYNENGSLRDRLFCKDANLPLSWNLRHAILRDASKGLLHLHSMMPKPLIHKNIKSSNVFLGANYTAKLGDYGFMHEESGNAIATVTTQVTYKDQFDLLKEWQAYLPDDFFHHGMQHSVQTDVHAFGMVILETCMGEDAVEWMQKKEQSLADYTHDQLSRYGKRTSQLISSLKDKRVFDWDDKLWMTVLMLGKFCTNKKRNERVTAQQIFDACDKCYGDVLEKLSSKMREGLVIGGDMRGSNFKTESETKKQNSSENALKDISKVQTTCMRKKLETDIYSPSGCHGSESDEPLSSGGLDCAGEDKDHVNALKFLDQTSSEISPENSRSDRKYFFKSSIPFSSNGSISSDSDANLEISFSSKGSSNEVSPAQQPKAINSSSDMESLIKKLLQQDQERFEKLQNLKKEFSDKF